MMPPEEHDSHHHDILRNPQHHEMISMPESNTSQNDLLEPPSSSSSRRRHRPPSRLDREPPSSHATYTNTNSPLDTDSLEDPTDVDHLMEKYLECKMENASLRKDVQLMANTTSELARQHEEEIQRLMRSQQRTQSRSTPAAAPPPPNEQLQRDYQILQEKYSKVKYEYYKLKEEFAFLKQEYEQKYTKLRHETNHLKEQLWQHQRKAQEKTDKSSSPSKGGGRDWQHEYYYEKKYRQLKEDYNLLKDELKQKRHSSAKQAVKYHEEPSTNFIPAPTQVHLAEKDDMNNTPNSSNRSRFMDPGQLAALPLQKPPSMKMVAKAILSKDSKVLDAMNNDKNEAKHRAKQELKRALKEQQQSSSQSSPPSLIKPLMQTRSSSPTNHSPSRSLVDARQRHSTPPSFQPQSSSSTNLDAPNLRQSRGRIHP